MSIASALQALLLFLNDITFKIILVIFVVAEMQYNAQIIITISQIST